MPTTVMQTPLNILDILADSGLPWPHVPTDGYGGHTPMDPEDPEDVARMHTVLAGALINEGGTLQRHAPPCLPVHQFGCGEPPRLIKLPPGGRFDGDRTAHAIALFDRLRRAMGHVAVADGTHYDPEQYLVACSAVADAMSQDESGPYPTLPTVARVHQSHRLYDWALWWTTCSGRTTVALIRRDGSFYIAVLRTEPLEPDHPLAVALAEIG